MQPPASVSPPLTSTSIRIGWFLIVPWTVALMVFSLRTDRVSLILAQLVFLLPLALATVCIFAIVRLGKPSLERKGWRQLAIATAFVLAGETFYSGYQIFVRSSGPEGVSAYDALSLAGAVIMISVLIRTAGLVRARRADNLRLAADLVALLTVTFMGMYHFWVKDLAETSVPWTASARWTAYSLVGVVMLVLVALSYVNLRPIRFPQAMYPLGVSLSIFSLGLVFSPVWQQSQTGGTDRFGAAIVICTMMLGYYLLLMAALARLVGIDRAWRDEAGRLALAGSIWPPTALSAAVLVSVGLMGWWAYSGDVSTAQASLYVGGAVIATLALVARTGFASMEAGEWRNYATTDPVTGALNHRSFQEMCEERIVAARRGEEFTIALLDIDDFSRINRVVGHAQGDVTLRAVATALMAIPMPGVSVFRLSGDEFAAIAPSVGVEKSLEFGRMLLAAIHGVQVAGLPGLSASVGVATCGENDCDREQLLVRADAAQAWAKYHGKNRVVAYDEHMVRSLGIEERLRIREHESHLGIARALSAAVDARDSRNYYHSRNVAALVTLLCTELGLDGELSRRIEMAGMLHDVGKIALSDETLKKRTPSPRLERESQEHATLGATLLDSLGDEDIPGWVRSHHERWDGAGYPEGLSGPEIPYAARIIALADAYDSMTSGRRGGRQMSKGAALQEIDHGIGTRFDPELAEAFIHIVGMTPSLGWSDEWVTS